GGVGVGSVATGPSVVVSSVSFANGRIAQVDHVQFDGFAGVFNVTPNAIMLASDASTWTGGPPGTPGTYTAKTRMLYLDISDPGGAIVQRGALTVDGRINGWGADNGRWNLDFADGKTAHVVGQASDTTSGYVLSTVDFSNPGAPALMSAFQIANTGWSAAARFDTSRLYLSPATGYYNGSATTPLQVYDLTDPRAPRLAGTAQLPGMVWNILPAPSSRIFALGNGTQLASEGDPVSVHYLDATDPAAPKLLGTSTFGQGWAWTPAAGTFKAFTMDVASGLVVVPFAGWDPAGRGYNNGLQLIEFTPSSVTTAGAARTKGWVERGIFVGNRLVSLSPQSLAVVDYTAPMAPRVVSELTLARNVVTAQPSGQTIAEVSSDWWGNDTSSSEVRVLPIGNAEETTDAAGVPTVQVDGVGAQVFTNGRYTYIVTSVPTDRSCGGYGFGCGTRTQQVQVVDLAGGGAVLRGKLQLPVDAWGGFGGWEGFWWWDWYWGSEVVQVGGDVLAFRRWEPRFSGSGAYLDTQTRLLVVDLANPDAPQLASVVVQTDPQAWWGNLKVVGDTLYTTHYEWVEAPDFQRGWVRYYLDSIDLGDRAHPQIGARVNVPGLLVGGDANDPSVIYTIDYRWNDGTSVNDLDVLRIQGSKARLLSQTPISGWVGSTFIVGTQAYLSAQEYNRNGTGSVDLHAIDLSNPSHPRDRIASEHGWGWLLAVAGDRALVTSGWSGEALDVYRLRAGGAPQFEQTVRTRGWGVNGVSRQDQTLFLSTGYWGVQKIALP
ncbi:MAG TPA: beta-propeller domain-containing protein, partial [Kofleriaceae bacterium]